MQELTSNDLFKGKKVLVRQFLCQCFSNGSRLLLQVILIGVPGAFTPTCSTKHLPGFVDKVDDFKGKGVDTIACTR